MRQHVKRVFATSGLMALSLLAWTGCGSVETDDASSIRSGLDLVELEENCDEAEAVAVKAHKVAICHIPPGNPANAHTIVVSVNAKAAHLAHGDVLGGCACDDIDHPGGGNPDGGGGDWDRPGKSDGKGNGGKNGGPHQDPGGDGDGDGDGSTGDGGGSYTPSGGGDDGSGGTSGGDDDGSGSGSGGTSGGDDDGSGSGSGGTSGGDDDGSGSGSGGTSEGDDDGSGSGTGGTSGGDDSTDGSGTGGDDGGDSNTDDGTTGGSGTGSGGDGGTEGVCDADQYLCDYDFNCPSNYACDMGCCVYVIR